MTSIIQDNKFCFVCGTGYGLHKHHIFFGTKHRKLADEDGLVVYLCYEHHLGNSGVHNNKELNYQLKIIGQKAYMIHYNKTKEDFMARYGKNYLIEE